MPWVLCNYTSATIDLRDPSNYRNLSLPMGAQTEDRRERAAALYEASAEMYDMREDPGAESILEVRLCGGSVNDA